MKRTHLPLKYLLLLFLLSLIVRILAALPQHHPQSMDEAYSYINAVTLAQGRGFTEDFIWNYLDPPPTIPHPGNLYWMPLSSLVAWPGLKSNGLSYDAAQLGFILLSALLPPLGYLIAIAISGEKRHGWVVAAMMLFSGFYFAMWTSVDSFTPFALAGAGCLYAAWLALQRGSGGWMILAGGLAGLGHLARADGPLLLITLGIALAAYATFWKTALTKPLTWSALGKYLALTGLGYLVVMAPWFWRNIQLVGSPLAPGGAKTIWLRSYDDLFSYNRILTLASYLDWGWAAIWRSKGWALGQNLQRLLGEQGMVFALPLALIGGWRLRRQPLMQLGLLYSALLFVALTFVFTFPGPRGAWFHSGGAILPFVFTAAAVGMDNLVEAIARRRRNWRVRPARLVFSAGLVLLAIMVTAFVYFSRIQTGGRQFNQLYPQITAHLAGEKATVMVGNPPAFLYHGGYRAIMVPNEPLDVTLQVADRYNVSYLILDVNRPQPLTAYYTDQVDHPRLHWVATFGPPKQAAYLFRILP